ncbi:hypothetical protein EDD11_009784 [Mortierella claussenii]|nr:hypothetical protein EDD11_009784 [Mortierella claussenii]
MVQSEVLPSLVSHFFKAVDGSRVPYLTACILEANFGAIRTAVLKKFSNAYAGQNNRLFEQDLVETLDFRDAEECLVDWE